MASESTVEDSTNDREVSVSPAEEGNERDNAQEDKQEGKEHEGSDSGSGSASPSPSASASKSPEPEPTSTSATPAPTTAQAQWQAVWSPQYNAYYFYNALTQETTWTNPLAPEVSTSTSAASGSGSGATPVPSTSTSTPAPAPAPEEANAEAGPSQQQQQQQQQQQVSAAQAHYAALQAAAAAQGIDPLLAHLDPTLVASVGVGGSGVPGDVPTFKAQFNAHTGRFTAANARTPGHLSEYERAKRMSEFYFDVNKWEEELARQGGSIMGGAGAGAGGAGEEGDGEGKKRKRPTKKDIERFKEQKRQKKLAKTAWLRT